MSATLAERIGLAAFHANGLPEDEAARALDSVLSELVSHLRAYSTPDDVRYDFLVKRIEQIVGVPEANRGGAEAKRKTEGACPQSFSASPRLGGESTPGGDR